MRSLFCCLNVSLKVTVPQPKGDLEISSVCLQKKEKLIFHGTRSSVKYLNHHLSIFHMATVHLCGNARQFVLHAVVFSKVWLNIYTY